MMIKRACLNACLVALGCLAGGAWAAPISFTEGVDLSDQSSAPTDLGSLDIGTNTVRGLVSAVCLPYPNCDNNLDDVDAFAVHLPSGLQITALSFDVSSFGAINVTGRARDVDVYAPLSVDFSFSDVGLFSLPGLPAAGPGDLAFVATGDIINPDSLFFGASYIYTWSITVAGTPGGQVPESGTLALVGVALAGLALMRRARRS